MTPYDIIQKEERRLKDNLAQKLVEILMNETDNFTDKTGICVTGVHFNFIDVSTIDKKQTIPGEVIIYKESV